MTGKCSIISNIFSFCSQIKCGIEWLELTQLVREANRGDPDQTAFSEFQKQSDLGLPCLTLLLFRVTNDQNNIVPSRY